MPGVENNNNFYDRRILQMEFENRKFQRNIAQSQKSVEDFKKVMNFDETSKGLEKFSKSVDNLDFSNLESYVERLADKFTGLGDAGEYMISRVRSAVEGAARQVESFVKSLTLGQISVGQTKYDAFNKAVMTITSVSEYAEEQVTSVFDRLMTYTDETSYSFSDMVNHVSSFVASNVGLEEAEKAMEGIANAAALAGQGVSQASAAMGVFSKAMGQGYLGREQWNSLNLTAHMITPQFRQALLEAAEEVGTVVKHGTDGQYRVAPEYRSDAAVKAKRKAEELQRQANQSKTAKNLEKAQKAAQAAAEYEEKAIISLDSLESTLHNKWATKEVLAKALEKFYFEEIDNPEANWDTFAGKAAKAAQRATSLTDAINALKESISGGWMTTFRHFWGEVSEATVTFTGLANRLIEVVEPIQEWRNKMLEGWVNRGGRTSIVHALLGSYTEDVKSDTVGFLDLLEGAGELISQGLSEFFKMFVPTQLRQYWEDEGFQDSFFSDALYGFTKSISEFFGSIRDYMEGDVLVNGQVKTRLQLIGEIVLGLVSVFKLAYDVASGFFGFLRDVASQFTVLDTFMGLLADLGVVVHSDVQAMADAKTIPEFFSNLAEALRPVTSVINTVVEDLANLVRAIFGIGNQNGTQNEVFAVIGGGIRFMGAAVIKNGKKILQFIGDLGTVIHKLLTSSFSKEDLIQAFTDYASLIRDRLTDAWETVSQKLPQELKTKVVNVAEKVKKIVISTYTNTIDSAANFFQKFNLSFGGFTSGVLNGIADWWGSVWKGIQSFFRNDILENVKTLISAAGQKLESVKAGLQSFGKGVLQVVTWLKDFMLQIGWHVVLWYSVFKIVAFIRNVSKIATLLSEGFKNITTILTKGVKIQPNVVTDTSDKFMKIAASVTMIIGAMVLLGSRPWNEIVNAIYVVTGVMIALELFIGTMSGIFKGIDNKKVISMAGMILGLAGLILVIIPLGFIKEGPLKQAGVSLLALLSLLALFSLALAGISKIGNPGLGKDSLDGVTKLAGGIFKLVLAIGLLSFIKEDALIKAGNALGLIALLLAAFSLAMSLISKIGNPGLGKDSLDGVTKLAGGILKLLIALIVLALFPEKSLIKAGVALAALFGLIGLFAFGMSQLNNSPLSKGNLDGVTKLAVAMSILIGVFATSLGKVKDIKWETMLSFSAGLTLIATSIWILSKVDFISGLKGIALLALAVGAIMEVVQLLLPGMIDSFAAGLQSVGGRLAAAGDSISVFVSSLSGIPDSDADRATGIIKKIRSMMEDAASIGEMSNDVDSFIVSLNRFRIAVGNFNSNGGQSVNGGLETAVSMIERLAGTSNSLTTLGKVDLSTFIGSLSGLGGALGIYASGAEEVAALPPDKKPSVEKSIEILEELSTGIKEHGGFEIPENIPSSSQLGVYGGQLAALATAMTKFEKAGSKLGSGTDKAIDSLRFFEKIALELNGYTFDLTDAVEYFAAHGIDDTKLNTFALDIQALGEGLANFSTSTTFVDEATGEIKPVNFDQAIETLRAFVQMENELDNPQGFADWLGGMQNNIGTLAASILQISGSLGTFTTTAVEISGKQTERDEAITALETFIQDVNTKLKPKLDDLYTSADGVAVVTASAMTRVVAASDDMARIGTNLGTYGEKIGKISWDSDAENQRNALQALTDFIEYNKQMEAKLPEMDGLLTRIKEWLISGGKMTLEDAAEQMGSVGVNLGKFGEGIHNKFGSLDEVNTALAALNGFVDILKAMAQVNDLSIFLGGSPEMLANNVVVFLESLVIDQATIGNATRQINAIDLIVQLMKYVSDEVGKLKGFDASAVSSFREMAEGMASLSMINEKTYNASAFRTFLLELADPVSVIGQPMVENWYKMGVGLTEAFTSGFEINTKSLQERFKAIGAAICQGVIKGINSGTISVATAAANMALKSYLAAKKAIDSNSPSKLFAELGTYITAGLAKGITDSTKKPVSAIQIMCDTMLTATREGFDVHSPSREFSEIGEYNTSGLLKGMEERILSAGAEIAAFSKTVIKTAGQELMEVVNDPATKDLMNQVLDAALREVDSLVEENSGQLTQIAAKINGWFGPLFTGFSSAAGSLQSFMNSDAPAKAGDNIGEYVKSYITTLLTSAMTAVNDPETQALASDLLSTVFTQFNQLLIQNDSQIQELSASIQQYIPALSGTVFPFLTDFINFGRDLVTGLNAANDFFIVEDDLGLTGFQQLFVNLKENFNDGIKYVDEFFTEIDAETGLTRMQYLSQKLNTWTELMSGDFLTTLAGTFQTFSPVITPIVEALGDFVGYRIEIAGPMGTIKALIGQLSTIAQYIMAPAVLDSLTALANTGVDLPGVFMSMAALLGALGVVTLASNFAPSGSLGKVVEVTAGMDVLMLNLVAALSALGGMDELTNAQFTELIERGASAIGTVFGALVGAFKGTSTAHELIETVRGMAVAAKEAEDIDEEGIKRITLVMNALKAITEGLPNRTVWDLLTGTPIQTFSSNIKDHLGPAISSFAAEVNNIPNLDKLDAGLTAMERLASMGQIISAANSESVRWDSGQDLLLFLLEVANPESVIGQGWSDNWTAFGSDLTDAFIAGFSLNLDTLATTIDGAIDKHPVITPVIDPSSINSTMEGVRNAFHTMRIDTLTPFAYVNSLSHPGQAGNGNQNETDLTKVYDHMKAIDRDIVELGEQISKLKLVLDTGALVGAITPHVDSAIGRLMYYAERRG